MEGSEGGKSDLAETAQKRYRTQLSWLTEGALPPPALTSALALFAKFMHSERTDGPQVGGQRMGRGRSIRRYAPLGIGQRRDRADRLNLTVCHRNQRGPIAGREQRQGKRKDRSRGSEGWILTRRPPNRLLLSPVLQGPLEPSDGFEPPKRGQVVHLQLPYLREPSALVSCGTKAKALLFARIYQPVGILSIPSSPTVIIRCFLNGFVDIFFSFDDLEPDWLHLHAGSRSLISSIGTAWF